MANYKKGTRVIRKATNQLFEIAKFTGFVRKRGSITFERTYQLKGPHRSLDLIVRESELMQLFDTVS